MYKRQIYSILFFLTEGSANITVRAHESTEQGYLGDGVAAWKSLKEHFDGNTKEARQACREKLFSSAMRAGSDPTDCIAKMDDLRLRLTDMGEVILDDTYADLLLNSFPKEFEFIKKMHHRDRSFTINQFKQTATYFYIDELSGNSSRPSVAGRGAAMAATFNNVQCHRCKAYGHYQSTCPGVAKALGPKPSKRKGKRKGGDPSPKWCSYHKPTSHSDSGCYKQKALKQLAAYLRV